MPGVQQVDDPSQSFGALSQRLYADAINCSRWSGSLLDFSVATSFDLVQNTNDQIQNQRKRFVLKNLTAKCFMPMCDDGAGGIVPFFSDLFGIPHSYTFTIRFNGQPLVWPVSFNFNIDSYRSELWMAGYRNEINNLSVSVQRDTFPVLPPGFKWGPVTLDLLIEGFLF